MTDDPNGFKHAAGQVLDALVSGKIKSEQDARDVVRRTLPHIPSYEVTGIISELLPKQVKETILKYHSPHPWFERRVFTHVFEDVWGRVWSSSYGTIKPDTKTVKIKGHPRWIDGLGGMSWRPISPGARRVFICEYRTSREEALRGGAKPQTFLS